jgi:hypothetical protein
MKFNSLFSKERVLVLVSGIFALMIVSLAIIGAFRSYSPVPFWDMWDGYLGFYIRVVDGDWSAWWAQHNEHRIILARLLFWADLKWFGGESCFLISTNYALVGLSALVFWMILRDSVRSPTSPKSPRSSLSWLVLGFFITAWLFLWIQNENLTWGFQSQFILAQLLPLCAFYCQHKSVAENNYRIFFVACGFGLASVGTMANGIITLPLMVCFALLTRQGASRVGALVVLSVITSYFYFYNYRAITAHGSILLAIQDNPFGLIQFLLLYLGSPFFWLLGKGEFGKFTAYLAGFFLVISAMWFTLNSLRHPKQATLQLALLFFILYIGGTALGTAGGRLIFGLDQALASRYTTPALMVWAALLVLYAPALLSAVGVKKIILLLPFALLALSMSKSQIETLKPKNEVLFARKIAALALELNIKDRGQIGHIFPNAEWALSLAEKASTYNLSIFGAYPYLNLREQLGQTNNRIELPACQGALDEILGIDGDTQFKRVSGWIFNPSSQSVPQMIRLLDDQGMVVGYALSGKTRPDVAEVIDRKAIKSGYQGYLLFKHIGRELTLYGESSTGPICLMKLNGTLPSAPLIPATTTNE